MMDTIKFTAVQNFTMHLYFDVNEGYNLDVKVNGEETTIKLTKEEANRIEKQLQE